MTIQGPSDESETHAEAGQARRGAGAMKAMSHFFANQSIARKIALVSGSILVLFAVATLVTVTKMNSAEQQFKSADEQRALTIDSTGIAREQLTQRALQTEFAVDPGPGAISPAVVGAAGRRDRAAGAAMWRVGYPFLQSAARSSAAQREDGLGD